MTEERFIKHVRQYGLLAQRTRKSYAEVISELTNLREKSIEEEANDNYQHDKLLDRMSGQLQREYGAFDPSWHDPRSG